MRPIFLLSLTFAASALGAPPVRAQEVAPPPPLMESLPEHLIYLYSGFEEPTPGDSARQIYAASRRWEPGRVLKVCFFQGNDVVAKLVRDAADEWNNYSSVKLDFGPAGRWYNCLSPQTGFAQIRVGFGAPGYWSVLGTDSETRLDRYAPSMNLQGFNRLYSPDRMQPAEVGTKAAPYHVATIKHEFGHALGLLHEHQNPTLGCTQEIKWTGAGNAYDYFAGPPNHWSRDQVQRNMGFIGQTDPDFISGLSDPKSIMMYALPAAILKQGKASPCFVDVNYSISDKDKQVVARIYPPVTVAAAPASEITLAAAPVRAMAAYPSPSELDDVMKRILVDLEAEDTFTRRDARARLADVLTKVSTDKVTELVRQTATSSYRTQLGIAVAVANAPASVRLSTESKNLLFSRSRQVQDATLRKQYGLASKR